MTRIIFLPSHNSSLLLSLHSSSNAQNHRKRFQLQLEFSRKYLFICSDLLFLIFNKIVLSDWCNTWAICGTRLLLQEYSSISNNTMKSILSMSALICFFPTDYEQCLWKTLGNLIEVGHIFNRVLNKALSKGPFNPTYSMIHIHVVQETLPCRVWKTPWLIQICNQLHSVPKL